jgi:hypothetical protein
MCPAAHERSSSSEQPAGSALGSSMLSEGEPVPIFLILCSIYLNCSLIFRFFSQYQAKWRLQLRLRQLSWTASCRISVRRRWWQVLRQLRHARNRRSVLRQIHQLQQLQKTKNQKGLTARQKARNQKMRKTKLRKMIRPISTFLPTNLQSSRSLPPHKRGTTIALGKRSGNEPLHPSPTTRALFCQSISNKYHKYLFLFIFYRNIKKTFSCYVTVSRMPAVPG